MGELTGDFLGERQYQGGEGEENHEGIQGDPAGGDPAKPGGEKCDLVREP